MRIKCLAGVRRPIVVGLACGIALTGAFFIGRAQAQQTAAFTITKPALLYVLIKPDKNADYEVIVGKLKEALQKTDKAELKQAASGWKIYKADAPSNNSTLYVHVIDPPAANADYTVMKILYDAFPAEAQAIFAQYKEAFVGQSPVTMSLVADLGK